MPRELDAALVSAIAQFRASTPSPKDLRDLEAALADFEDGGTLGQLKDDLQAMGIAARTPKSTVHQQLGNRGARPTAALPRGPENLADLKEYLTASYRFVANDPDLVVRAEPAALEPINQPKRDGLNAEITVNWTAQTPLLVGEKSGDGVSPIQIGEDWIIPGSTLRGVVRSVAEIIGGARLALAHVNHAQVFGLRDFTHASYANQAADSRYPVGSINHVKAGWLTVSYDLDPANLDPALYRATARIEPVAKWYKFRVDSDSKGQRLVQKYQSRRLTKRLSDKDIIDTAQVPKFFEEVSQGVVKEASRGQILGHYVFSDRGLTGDQRRNPIKNRSENEDRSEYIFAAHDTGAKPEAIPLKDKIWQRFVRLHSRSIGDKLKPFGAWEVFTDMLKVTSSIKIPIFYVGDLNTQDPSTFAFGLTRLFKVPHKWSLADVMEKSGVKDPLANQVVDANQIDMVDALFGYVYKLPEKSADPNKPSEFSRRGRIAFSLAKLLNPLAARITSPVKTVEGGPQPAFAPFYLAGSSPDYSAEQTPKIAGRKRYPARNDASFNSIKGRLEARAVGLNAGPDLFSNLSFLEPNSANGMTFQSTIRLTNVTNAELGLVLSAINLGDAPSRYHAIGRAKNEGAGQVKAEIVNLSVEFLAKAGVIQNPAMGAFIEGFEAHVQSELGEARLKKFNEIRDSFYRCCDPSHWGADQLMDNAMRRRGGKFSADGFKKLRAETKLDKDGRNNAKRLANHLSLLDARRKH